MQQNQKTGESGQSFLIVVFGPPASGKSTFAKQLHDSYREYCLKNTQLSASLMISTDCLEEYLRDHTVADLKRISLSEKEMEEAMRLRLKRSKFIEQNWKESRQFVKQHLPKWLKVHRLVIVQDDMLLKSQRKHMRHIAEQEKCLYLEVCIEVQLERCIKNLKNRYNSEEQQFRLTFSKCQEAFKKFEVQQNPYLMKLPPDYQPSWIQFAREAKIVMIQHPQLQEKSPAPQQNKEKDDVQVKIRKFVSEIISQKELHKKYFPNADTKKIASLVGSIKKRYMPKIKTFQGFLQFFKNETDSFY